MKLERFLKSVSRFYSFEKQVSEAQEEADTKGMRTLAVRYLRDLRKSANPERQREFIEWLKEPLPEGGSLLVELGNILHEESKKYDFVNNAGLDHKLGEKTEALRKGAIESHKARSKPPRSARQSTQQASRHPQASAQADLE